MVFKMPHVFWITSVHMGCTSYRRKSNRNDNHNTRIYIKKNPKSGKNHGTTQVLQCSNKRDVKRLYAIKLKNHGAAQLLQCSNKKHVKRLYALVLEKYR